MAIKDLKKVKGSTDEISRMQSNLENWAKAVQKNTPADGVMLSGVKLTTGSVNNVEHKLGRVLQGWQVIGRDSNAQIWDSQADNVFKAKFLALNCSADVTVNLWVF